MVATANVQVECEHGVCRPKGALTPGAIPEKEEIPSTFLEFQGNFTCQVRNIRKYVYCMTISVLIVIIIEQDASRV